MSSRIIKADIPIPRRCAPGIALSKPQQVGARVAKTGLANLMRDWMKSRTGTKAQRRFTVAQICDALAVITAKQHQSVANTLTDFVNRKEVGTYFNAKRNRRQYIYILDWKKVLKGKINKKIFKAMYVSQTFAVTDLQRLTGITERNWFDKIIRQLKENGHITQIQRRRCVHGTGAENVYHIIDRDKFNKEIMR